jgi:hypothetical protein
MTKIALACAAAGMLLAAPNFITPAAAVDGIKVAQVDVRIGAGPDRRYHHRHYRAHRVCSKTVIYRHGRKTVITKCR